MPNVLIVDDDKDMAEGLKWYLEADGFGVTMAYDGEAALDDFRSQKPDLVILDIMMPKLDGIQVCQAIRSESSAMVIMLSARDSEIDKVRALKLGADDYVTTPFFDAALRLQQTKPGLHTRGRASASSPSSAAFLLTDSWWSCQRWSSICSRR